MSNANENTPNSTWSAHLAAALDRLVEANDAAEVANESQDIDVELAAEHNLDRAFNDVLVAYLGEKVGYYLACLDYDPIADVWLTVKAGLGGEGAKRELEELLAHGALFVARNSLPHNVDEMSVCTPTE